MGKKINLLKTFVKINLVNVKGSLFKVDFAVTYKCNYRCRMCNVWRVYREKPGMAKDELDIDEIKRIFQNYNRFIWVSLTGGEPFLRPDLVDIVRVIHESCKELSILNIPTNGGLPSYMEKRIYEIAEDFKIPLVYLTVSLDGDEIIHNFMRGVDDAWSKALDTLIRFRQLSVSCPNLAVGFEYTLSPFNVGSLELLLTKLRKCGVTDLEKNAIITLAHNGNLYHNTRMCVLNDNNYASKVKKEIECVIKSVRVSPSDPISIVRHIYLELLLSYLSKPIRQVLPCTAASGSCFIDPYGRVYPCIILGKILGSLRETDYNLDKIIKSSNFTSFRNRVKKGLCVGCWSPCEAYPSIVAHPLVSLVKAYRGMNRFGGVS